MELCNTVYALDSTTIDLCLSLFPWAPFRSTKAGVKMHTLLDLRGAIPSFIHISDGKCHDVNILDLLLPEPGAFYVVDRGYLDWERLHTLHRAGSFFVIRAKSNLDFHRLYSASVDRSTGVICDQTSDISNGPPDLGPRSSNYQLSILSIAGSKSPLVQNSKSTPLYLGKGAKTRRP